MSRHGMPMTLLVLMAGCSSGAPKPPPPGGSSGPPFHPSVDAGADAGADTSAADEDASVATPAEQRLAWVLAALNGAPLTDADLSSNFDATFLQAMPPADVRALTATLAMHEPWKLAGFEGNATSTALVAILLRDDGEYYRLTLVVGSSAPNLISTLFISVAGDLDPSLSSYPAVDGAMAALAPSVAVLAANVDASGSGCTPVHSLNPTSSLAIGSAFKLWVLAALAQSVDTGARAWTDTIAIEDRYKSLPSGTLQNTPAGTTLSLLALAKQMISISDNTAADHLLFTLGRPAVEAMLSTTRHHDPSIDQPFLATRELFDLKLLSSPAEQAAYLASSVDQKRALLASYDTTLDPRTFAGPAWTSPRLIDKIEWFASPLDLCEVMSALKTYGDKSATKDVYAVLSVNPGVTAPKGLFDYVGYKGGSEPGVLDLTWLLRRTSDQSWVFYSVGWNDAINPINEGKAVYLASAGRALLAK